MHTPTPLTPDQYESLGRMTQSLLHAVNNSLASITGFAEFLIEDTQEGSQSRSFAENIHQSGQHLKRLVEQIRTINSAPQIAHLGDIDLCETLESLLLQLTEALPKELNIKIEYECNLEKAKVEGNQALFSLAILDLINNALESLSDSEKIANNTGKITVSLTDNKENKSYTIKIEDNGKGMDEITKIQSVAPFFTTKDSSKHHGLGLSVALAIISAMGGELNITSKAQVGCAVTLDLPYTG